MVKDHTMSCCGVSSVAEVVVGRMAVFTIAVTYPTPPHCNSRECYVREELFGEAEVGPKRDADG